MKKGAVLLDEEQYPPFEGFSNRAFAFFRGLKRNNNREWYEAHKEEYEEHVKLPMQLLVASLRNPFAQVAPEFELNPKRSIFRIYRDVRFSRDKTPYKTHIAAHFVLRGMPKGFLGSGYYLHIEPDECFVGGGIYMPDSDQLKKIRKMIAARGEEFLSIVNRRSFVKRFGKISGERLQRMPKGYEEGHPMEEWLKFKQFFVGVSMKGGACVRPSYVDDVAAICEEAAPLVRFLNGALVER